MSSDLNLNGAEYIQFALIVINTSEGSDKIKVQILMFRNKNQWLDLQVNRILSHKSFNVYADFTSYKTNMKFYILEAIFELFPKHLYLNEKTILWDFNIDETQIEEKILNKLKDNPYFNNPIEKMPVEIGRNGDRISYCINEHPLHEWAFNMINIKSELSLENIACNNIANLFMKKVIKIAENEGTDLFDCCKKDKVQLRRLISAINPLNILLLLERDKISKFREIYQTQLEGLILPNTFLNILESYCPKDSDFIEDPEPNIVTEMDYRLVILSSFRLKCFYFKTF